MASFSFTAVRNGLSPFKVPPGTGGSIWQHAGEEEEEEEETLCTFLTDINTKKIKDINDEQQTNKIKHKPKRNIESFSASYQNN